MSAFGDPAQDDLGVRGHRSSGDSPTHKIYRFGDFELRSDSKELYKRGIRIRLQAKPIAMLEELLRSHGEVIRRETLVSKLWPETFVDYQSGLNTAINRLRVALGDSPDAPRYIETLPRLGYRFICPVQVENIVAEESADPVSVTPSEVAQTDVLPNYESRSAFSKKIHYFSYGAIGALGLILGLVPIIRHLNSHTNVPKFYAIPLNQGQVLNARFMPSKDKVALTASTDSGTRESFVIDLKHSKPQTLPFLKGYLASVSPRGELAVISRRTAGLGSASVLSRVSPEGVARDIAGDVRAADWDSAGGTVAIAREHGGGYVVEFPPQHVIYRTSAWIDCIRVSPRNNEVAFLEHAMHDDDAGHVRLIGLDGKTKVVSPEWGSVRGLAWSRSGNEVWTSGSKVGVTKALYAISAQTGKVRLVSSSPSSLKLFDIGRSGSVLVGLEDERMTMLASFAGEIGESNLSGFEFSHIEDMTADGNLILYTVAAQTGSEAYDTYVYDHRRRQSRWVTAGRGLAFSQDGKRVLTMDPKTRTSLTLRELDTGKVQVICGGGLVYQWARLLPGGRELVAGGSFKGQALGLFRQPLEGLRPERIDAAPYLDNVVVAPAQGLIAGTNEALQTTVLEVYSGRIVRELPGRFPVGWSEDARAVYLVKPTKPKDEIVRYDFLSKQEIAWKEIGPSGAAGYQGLGAIVAAPGAGAYAYSAAWNFSHLFVVDGWS